MRSLQEIHCGTVEGWPLTRVRSEHPDLWAQNFMQTDDSFCWPGGESYSQFRRRVLRALWAIARQHGNEQVIIVTHAGVVSQLLGWMHGASAARWEPFRPGNASITTVVPSDSGWSLESFDDSLHLG